MRSRLRSVGRSRHRLVASLAGTVLAGGILMAVGPGSAVALSSHSAQALHRYHFDAPTSAAVVGAHLFVANKANNSVTEIKTANGSYVANLAGKHFGFDAPAAIVAVGSDLFVANSGDNTVSEFSAAHHQYLRTISGAGYGFDDPLALAPSGPDLFVLNGGGSLTELDTATGALIGTASGPTFGFDAPTGLAVADGSIFVADSAADAVTVVDASTLDFVASLSGSPFSFSTPIGVAFDGSNVWVTNQGDESVTEFSPTSLAFLNKLVSWNLPDAGPITYGNGYVFAVSPPGSSPMVSQISTNPAVVNWMMCNTNGPYLFNDPEAVVVVGTNLWVVNEGGNSLTEMDTVSGDLIRTVANR